MEKQKIGHWNTARESFVPAQLSLKTADRSPRLRLKIAKIRRFVEISRAAMPTGSVWVSVGCCAHSPTAREKKIEEELKKTKESLVPVKNLKEKAPAEEEPKEEPIPNSKFEEVE